MSAPILIRINESLIVSSLLILKASRNGNYTDIYLQGKDLHCPVSTWDQESRLWHQVCAATESGW